MTLQVTNLCYNHFYMEENYEKQETKEQELLRLLPKSLALFGT